MEIKNVIICGLGALGLTYANQLKNICELRILADIERVERYKKYPRVFNGQQVFFDYIIPSDKFDTDLIILSTKFEGLNSALEYIKNFIGKNTIIISLINGISSEDRILEVYPNSKVLRSYFIGHSAIRDGNVITQDGQGKIVFEPNDILESFFLKSGIDYEVSENILYSQWLKLGVNIVLNQFTALYQCTVGDLRARDDYMLLAQGLLKEVKEVAKACGVVFLDDYEYKVFESINLVADDGITSMYQDIIYGRETEVDIFSGEIIRLGKIYGIKTPKNDEIYTQIKLMQK